MFGKDKDIPLGKEQSAPPPLAAEVLRPLPRPSVAASSAASSAASLAAVTSAVSSVPSERTSSISAGMSIFGKVVGDGDVQVFGRIEGELQASSVQICQGARIEGNVVAEQIVIGGRLKGTIHAVRVKLLGTADVEGDIFHRSLAIEENARFEGASRREDNLADKSSSLQPKAANPPSPVLSPTASTDSSAKFNGKPEEIARSVG